MEQADLKQKRDEKMQGHAQALGLAMGLAEPKWKEPKDEHITLGYWNTRGLGDGWKQQQTLEAINTYLDGQPDILIRSETNCKAKINLHGLLSFQTRLSARGGTATIFQSEKSRRIKALNENIFWTTGRHEGALVHYICLYIPPNNATIADLTLRQTKWILHRIFKIDAQSKVIIAGDLNRVGMKKCAFLESQYQLKPSIDSDTATHKLGGHLDNVWSNLTVTATKLVNQLDFISDHSLFEIKFLVEKEVSRKIPDTKHEYFTSRDIRQTNTSNAMIHQALAE